MSTDALEPDSPQTSLWHRLRHTPLGDVLRGRLTCRLDVGGLIASSDLPVALRACVEDVVRRTRLRRSEKADVAQELITHFADGLGAGASVESLLLSFGDRIKAARLIKRAKKRNRSLLWRVPVRTVQVTAVSLAALYVVLLVRVNFGSVSLARDYIAEFNAPALAVPQAERAWPIYRDAALSVTPWPKHLSPDDTKVSGPRWDELVGVVRASTRGLELYREAAGRPALGFVVGTEPDIELLKRFDEHVPVPVDPTAQMAIGGPMVMQVVLPHIRPLRNGARLLAVDARLAAVEGDADRCVADFQAMLSMSEHLAETPFVICHLVSLSIAAETAQLVRAIVWDHPDLLNGRQLAGAAHVLSALRDGRPLRVTFEAERAAFEDVVQRLYTDDGEGNGHLSAERFPPHDLAAAGGPPGMLAGGALLMPFVSAVVVDRRELMRRYDEHVARVEAWDALPLWGRDQYDPDADFDRHFRTGSWQFVRYWPLAVLFPSLTRASVLGQLATQQRDATLVVIALELYRREHGDWPTTLHALTPKYLPHVPPDRQDGQPLRYRVIDGRPVLYSLGFDRDDDGGRAPIADTREWALLGQVQQMMADPRNAVRHDGDAVFWPPTAHEPD